MKLRVDHIQAEAADVLSFRLVHPDGSALPPFQPGAHIDVHPGGGGMMRQYSLTNGPDDRDHYTVGVKKEPRSRGGSLAMHALMPGVLVEVGEPRHNFPLDMDAPHSILLAGGIGLTPLLSMARHLAAAGRSFALHVFSRSPEHTPFRAVLDAPPLAGHVSLWHLDDPAAVRDRLASLVGGRPPGAQLYVCGPTPFMDAAMAAATAWPAEAKHLEHFGAVPSAAAEPGGAFEVVLSRSGGQVVPVAPDQTIVQALADAGVAVDVSCEQGICGTCVTPVLDGTPDHRDSFLTDEERAANDCMTLCVSRARSPRLVLDL